MTKLHLPTCKCGSTAWVSLGSILSCLTCRSRIMNPYYHSQTAPSYFYTNDGVKKPCPPP